MIQGFRTVFFIALVALVAGNCKKQSTQTASPEGAEVFIISPADGETVTSPVTVKFGVKNMEVAPAGSDVSGSGHHHLLIDTEALPAMNTPMPADDHLKHFGKGQTEVSLTLAPGEHTLQLIMGDKNHVPHNPAVISKKIKITVK